MTSSLLARALALPAAAVVLVGGVLGVQYAHGGGDFTPAKPANPCTAPVARSVSTGIQGLGERVVLTALDGAACRLHVSREALTLTLAEPGPHTKAQADALPAGLLEAVSRLKAAGALPAMSTLAPEAIDNGDLPGFVKLLLRHLPSSVIDSNLKTDDVLRRAIGKLDIALLLDHLDDPDKLTPQINSAVTKAVEDALLARLKSLI